mmetsp:Transcript_17942/g.18011  ORF Transcript_17942/g.18011 Transcript_17942/m.18011 type:complete len:252 (-) Transcript_17942:33-788(-)
MTHLLSQHEVDEKLDYLNIFESRVSERFSTEIENSTDKIIQTLIKHLITKKSINNTLRKIPCITPLKMEEMMIKRSYDGSWQHIRTVDKVEESKATIIALLHNMKDHVTTTIETHENTQVLMKEQLTSNSHAHLEAINNDIVRDSKRNQEAIITQLKEESEILQNELHRIEEKLEKIQDDTKQELISLMQEMKEALYLSQEQLISNYTNRIITQVIFVFGIAVGIITEYDYYKEKMNMLIGFLTHRRQAVS